MRAVVPDYEVDAPSSLAEATTRLAAEPGVYTLLAGGTDIMVLFEAGQLQGRRLMSLHGLAELRGIKVTPEAVELGALTTYADVQRHELLRREFPNLCRAAAETGSLAIQNRGTLGGNIANASPAADSPPALLTADCELKLVSARGERWVPYWGFQLGYKRLATAPGELLAALRLPRPKAPRQDFYRKVGTRRAQAISKVVVAASAVKHQGRLASVRLAFGSVAPTTLRCPRTERLLEGAALSSSLIERAITELASELAPIDDIRSTASYRAKVAGNILRQYLDSLR